MYNFFTAFLLVIALSAAALMLSSMFTYPSTVSRVVHPIYGSRYSVRMQPHALLSTSARREVFCNAHNGSQHAAVKILSQFDRSLTFVDIGAATGNVALVALFCVPTPHRVIAVEPLSGRYEALLNRLEELGGDDVNQERFFAKRLAFANDSARRVVSVAHGGNLKELNHSSSPKSDAKGRGQHVEFVRADEFLEKNGIQADFVRVDVQADELNVLHGMQRLLRTKQNMLIMVEHEKSMLSSMGKDWSRVHDFMTGLQYRAYCEPEGESKGGEFHTENEEFTREQVGTVPCGQLLYWKHLSSNMGSVVGRF